MTNSENSKSILSNRHIFRKIQILKMTQASFPAYPQIPKSEFSKFIEICICLLTSIPSWGYWYSNLAWLCFRTNFKFVYDPEIKFLTKTNCLGKVACPKFGEMPFLPKKKAPAGWFHRQNQGFRHNPEYPQSNRDEIISQNQ